jgi:8-oxo-dGTP pyrophosphatase MutT (NUDIX family)
MRLRRSTARVLPVNREGRVLLQLAHELRRRDDRHWLSIGGGVARGETLAQAAAREMREEAGIDVDPAALGRPIGTTVIGYPAFGLVPVCQYQTYFAFPLDEAQPDFRHASPFERLTIAGYEWLSADELERRPERLTDAALPRLARAAVAAVAGRRP